MKLHILGALLRKELRLMKRNPIIPKVIAIMPVMVMLIVPLIATLDVKNVDVAVVDNDRTELSRRIWQDMDASEVLSVKAIDDSYDAAADRMRHGKAYVIIDIPQHFTRDLESGKSPLIDVEANGVDAIKGVLGAQYVVSSITESLTAYRSETGAFATPERPAVTYKYNPTLNFRNYMIPALIVVLIIIICGFLPTLNIVGEKESGTIEAINVTPVKKLTFVLSKLIPYWIAGLIVVTVGMLVGWLVYGLRPEGSILSIYLAAILFTLVMSGLGVAIANMSDTVLQSIFVMFAFIMIFQLMSGLFTPITSMPEWAQLVTVMVPPRYFIEIMRSLYLKATPITELLPQFGALCLFAVGFSLWATLTYRKRG